jgi:hypothetical protein
VTTDFVGNRSVDNWNLEHRSSSSFLGLGNARGNFVGFPVTVSDLAATIPDNNQGCEAEASATFDHRRTSLDLQHAVDLGIALHGLV